MRSLLVALFLVFGWSAASALEYRSMAEPGVVYDAGSKESKPLFILLRGTPVEVIVSLDRWVKVREVGGGIGWVERSQLSERKQLIVTVPQLEIRQSADPASSVVAQVARDVLLEWVDGPVAGMLKVRHQDGTVGFVPVKSVWGI